MSHAPATASPGHPSVRRSRAAALGVSLLAAAALLVPASVAAHTPDATFTCVQDAPQLHVDLTNYNGQVTNTVGVWIDGVAVDSSPFTFGSSFDQSWWATPAWDAHSAVVSINAGDDPTGQKGWTKEIDLRVDACVEQTPSPSDTATPSESASPSDSATPTPTETAPPTGSAEPSSGTPTPTGSAEASSGTPGVTPPATSTDSSNGGSGNGALLFVLALMALGTTGVLVLAPSPVSRRRR